MQSLNTLVCGRANKIIHFSLKMDSRKVILELIDSSSKESVNFIKMEIKK